MKNLLSKQELIDFEDNIAKSFNEKQIRAPIHLEYGNEKQLLKIFENVQEDDWICATWRSHYKCLLKGVPKEVLKRDILSGKSISLCYKEQKIISSGIVGGTIPIALGIALDIKRLKKKNHVWCFLGDMGSTTGGFHECYNYAFNFVLPVTYIVEDNGKSVCTDTRKVWNINHLYHEPAEDYSRYTNGKISQTPNLIYYKY